MKRTANPKQTDERWSLTQSPEKREQRDRRLALVCFGLGFLSLACGIVFVAAAPETAMQLLRAGRNELPVLVSIALRQLGRTGLFIAFAKYAFTLGKVFLDQSLKSSDRLDALFFAKQYLTPDQLRANWKEIQNALQTWGPADQSCSLALDNVNALDPNLIALMTKLFELGIAETKK